MANSHTKEQREFIVRKLAAFEPPRAIVIDFVAVFPAVRVDENDVKRLDRDSGAVLSPELHLIFNAERERVLLDPEKAAPYISRAARLIGMDRQARFYVSNNQLAEARTVWRQMAEEQGVVGGKGAGKPVPAAGTPSEPIVAIERRVVDPKAPEQVA